MPKSIIKNPATEATKIIVGDPELLNLAVVSRKTDIPKQTLVRAIRINYDIGELTVKRFSRLCETLGATDAEIVSAVRLLQKGVI